MKKNVRKMLKRVGLIVALAAISVTGYSNITAKAQENVNAKLRDINGNPVLSGENYYLISKGRDYDSYEKGGVSHKDKLTGDYLYVDPSEEKATPIQIYKEEKPGVAGQLIKDKDIGYFKMNGKYLNFATKQFCYVELEDEKKGSFQFLQQGTKNQMKLLAGTAKVSYDNFGRPSTGLFDHTNVSNESVYLNASKVGPLGHLSYDDMWVEISPSSLNMTNNYALKPVPKISSKQGDVLKFNYYNNDDFENKTSSKNGPFVENGTKYRVKYHVIANSDTNLSLSFRDKKIAETNISKTTADKYTTVDGPVVVLSKGENTVEVENVNGGNVKISHVEFIHLNDSDVTNLNPIKKELDLDKTFNVRDAINQSAAYYSPDQNVVYLGNTRQYITYKFNAPEKGEYKINLGDSVTSTAKGLNLISNLRVLNLNNNKYNKEDKIELVKGENKLKVLVKPFESSYVDTVSINENGVKQSSDKYEAELLKNGGKNIKVEGSKVTFNGLDSYVDLKINNKTGNYKDVTIDVQGKGEFVLTNQYSGATIYGPSHINNVIDRLNWAVRKEIPSRNMKLNPGVNIIRISPQNNGHLLNTVNVKRYFREIVGYSK